MWNDSVTHTSKLCLLSTDLLLKRVDHLGISEIRIDAVAPSNIINF